ncbi:MAG: DNA polymerase III subunit gamma/tau [Clostridiales bacterium]|nr:DNA polymerase III subunit gamma/tau [Clostridiales bacterium]
MGYTALYRKFRPLKFEDMVGQSHITRTLKNQIIANRVGHAYLFNGGRGTGKTSAAKILARTVNCLNPQDGEPCNECEMCRDAITGSLIDIVEMDAASNNGVEDIRAIREAVNFLPTKAKYKVYIIDEVHMLSTGAFNALLKTLEEPPEHVKFILATTEPQKLPATILSRCQRFDFKRIKTEDVVKRLKIICKESNIEASEEALKLIAVLSEGAMRDSISILERCAQENAKIEEETVRDLVGIPKMEYIYKIAENIIEKNSEGAILVINEILNEGRDIDNFLWEIIKYMKDILVFKTCNSLEVYNVQEQEKIKELADKASKEKLIEIIYVLSELANDIKWSSQKTIMFEAGIIKACMERRVEVAPTYIQETRQNSNANYIPTQSVQENRNFNVEPKKEVAENPRVISVNDKNNLPYWNKILDTLKTNGKVMIYTNLIGTKAKQIDDMTVGIEFSGKISSFGKTILENYDNKAEIERLIAIEAGQKMHVKYLEGGTANIQQEKQGNSQLDDISKKININIIDE